MRGRLLWVLPVFALTAWFLWAAGAKRPLADQPTVASANWEVAGVWSEACDCDPPCPCWKKKPPTLDHCENTMVFKIERGHYGKVALDGLVVAVVWVSPKGVIMDENPDRAVLLALYLDKSTTPAQREAVQKIWHDSFLAGMKGQKGGLKAVTFRTADFRTGYVSVSIPGILAYEIKEWKDSPVKLQDPYLSGFRQGSSLQYRYADFGLKWNYPGKHAMFAAFHVQPLQQYHQNNPE